MNDSNIQSSLTVSFKLEIQSLYDEPEFLILTICPGYWTNKYSWLYLTVLFCDNHRFYDNSAPSHRNKKLLPCTVFHFEACVTLNQVLND